MAWKLKALFNPGGNRLYKTYHRRDACHRQHEKKQHTKPVTPGHLREAHWQGLEDQASTGRRVQSVVEYNWKNNQTSQQGHTRINHNNNQN